MAGFVAQGATCTFTPASGGGAVTFLVTRIAVGEPQAEVADMTPVNAAGTALMSLVPTGEWSDHGTIDLSFICGAATKTLRPIIGKRGTLAFNSPGYSASFNAIAVSGAIEAGVGAIVTGNASFRVTTYTAA